MRTFSFVYFSFRRNASWISRILRFTSRLGVSTRFLTSCWVMVEPPCAISPDVRLVMNALATAPRSMPSFVQKLWSSIAITALISGFGISSNVTTSRCCKPRYPITLPSAA